LVELNRETLKAVILRYGELLTADPKDLIGWCRSLLDNMLETDRGLVSDMLHEVRRDRARLVERYANRFYFQLRLESRISTTPRLTRLFELAGSEEGSVNRDRLFEGLSLFLLSVAAACLERELPRSRIGHELDALIDLFARELFPHGRRNVPFWTYHEKRSMRVHEGDVGIGQRLHRNRRRECRQKPLTCYFLEPDRPVFIDDRPKEVFETLLKIFYQIEEAERDSRAWAGQDPFEIRDRAALWAVVPTVEATGHLIDRIADVLGQVGGYVEEDVPRPNGDSSPNYRPAKVFLVVNGVRPELQVPTFARMFSGQCALDQENHALYKQRRCTRVYLPQLFPEEVYGINWGSGRTRSLLEEDQRVVLRQRIRELRT
jgi:hypothetical protein